MQRIIVSRVIPKHYRSFSTTCSPKSKSIGLVGLPNVGKSCLFNALMGKELARSENYPFCTINPTSGNAVYHDERLRTLANIIRPKKMTPVPFEFVDIAGLVEGASDGQGLGNKFLDNIRGVDAILHVVRCFPIAGSQVTHVFQTVDPVRDIKIIEEELRLKDIQSLASIHKIKKGKEFKFDFKSYQKFVDSVLEAFTSGLSGIDLKIDEKHPDFEMFQTLQLLSSKPLLYLCNVDESSVNGNDMSKIVSEYAASKGRPAVTLSARLEFELATTEPAARQEFREIYGITENGISNLIKHSFELLGLHMFYTMGPKEVRGWPVKKGSTARECAGKIHSDFEQGFIKADHWTYDEVVQTKGKYKITTKGADYVMKDGDCFEFKVKT